MVFFVVFAVWRERGTLRLDFVLLPVVFYVVDAVGLERKYLEAMSNMTNKNKRTQL